MKQYPFGTPIFEANSEKPESPWGKMAPVVISVIALIVNIIGNTYFQANLFAKNILLSVTGIVILVLCVNPTISSITAAKEWLKRRRDASEQQARLRLILQQLSKNIIILNEIMNGQRESHFLKVAQNTNLGIGYETSFIRTIYENLIRTAKIESIDSLQIIESDLWNLHNFLSNRLTSLNGYFLNNSKFPPEEGIAKVIKYRRDLESFLKEYNLAIVNVRTLFSEHYGRKTMDTFSQLNMPEEIR